LEVDNKEGVLKAGMPADAFVHESGIARWMQSGYNR
jgi:hypothetical protein